MVEERDSASHERHDGTASGAPDAPGADSSPSPYSHPGAPQWVAPGAPGYGTPGAAAPDATAGPSVPGTPPGYSAPGYVGQHSPEQLAAAPTFRSWQPGIIPLRPLTFGDFLTVPFKAMRFNRSVVLGAPLLFTLLSTILVLTTMWLVFTDPQLGLLNFSPTLSGISWTTVAMIVVSLFAVLLADVFSASIIAPGVARAVLGERIGIAVAWRQVRRRLGSLMLLYLASATALALLTLITLSPMLVSLVGGDSDVGVVVLSVLLAFAVLIPAGLLVMIFQGIARAMIVLEGIHVGTALRRTVRLIRGRFWWTVLIVFVASLLINVISTVLQYVGQFGSIAISLFAPENTAVLAIAFMVVYGLTYVVSLVLVYSYLGSVSALVYIDLRMRHEGFDLDLARAAEERAGR